MSGLYQVLNFKKWIDDNRHLFKPPVGNKVIWQDREFIVMVVGGPNKRSDFHVNEGEEFFYQIEGRATLKIIDNENKARNVVLSAGDIYLLPAKTPHSPQREANSIGLVVERRRRAGEQDGFQWYCDKCGQKLYEEFFALTDIETQLPEVFGRYFAGHAKKCKSCGHEN